jgi:integrase
VRIKDTIERLKAAPPTPHDLRRTTASGLAALGVPREDRLAILAHSLGDVHAIHYDRHDRFAEKRRALGAWERHLATIIDPHVSDNVLVFPLATS